MDAHAHDHAAPPACDHCAPAPAQDHGAHAGHGGTTAALTTSATLHCLTGCAVGELIGLVIATAMGLGAWPTMILATAMGYASGFALSLKPLLASGMGVGEALRSIWLGEVISIGVMEIAMNATDYFVGGVGTASFTSARFWIGYALALPAGFAAAWPVNYWMLSRNIKKHCH
jgi:hypothetical protein